MSLRSLRAPRWAGLLLLAAALGCAESESAPAASDSASDDLGATADTADAPPDDVPTPADLGPDDVPEPEVTPEDTADTSPPDPGPQGTDASRARAFKLFYKERLDRVLVAYNRFALFGDPSFGIAVDRADVAREGTAYDVVVGPKDNNLIGTPIRAVWHAWRHFRTRTSELTLLRMLRGLQVYEAVTGIPGLTSRMVLPGWTLTIDGNAKTAQRTRHGATVVSPLPVDAALEAELIETFWGGITMTVRMDPTDTYLTYLPGRDPVDYAITHSIPNLPDFIRISDCCATLRQTPAGYAWAGAWWSNHNSRDNFPDIALGFVAATEAASSPDTPADLKAVAADVVAAGHRVADRIDGAGGNIETIDEYHAYGELTVSGEVRPHGLPENENLGSMGSCPMALLNRALTTQGLDASPKGVLLPGTIEALIQRDYPGLIDCPFEAPRQCTSIDDAICGLSWGELDQLTVFGTPIFEFGEQLEADAPGSSEGLLGAFQNDFDDITEGMVSLHALLVAQGKAELAAQAQASVGHLTDVMRRFADLIYSAKKPQQQAEQRYEAAIFDALAGREVDPADLGYFAIEEGRVARAEALLTVPEASPAPLYTDEQLAQMVEAGLAGLEDKSGAGRSDAIRKRYAETYPDGVPPIRRAGDAYEARQGQGPWVAAERPRHVPLGSFDLLQAVILCSTAPQLLDCSWAAIGCGPLDLDGSGTVDAEDAARFEAAVAQVGEGSPCADSAPAGCGGADLDGSGTVDASDRAFMAAAQGCVR